MDEAVDAVHGVLGRCALPSLRSSHTRCNWYATVPKDRRRVLTTSAQTVLGLFKLSWSTQVSASTLSCATRTEYAPTHRRKLQRGGFLAKPLTSVGVPGVSASCQHRLSSWDGPFRPVISLFSCASMCCGSVAGGSLRYRLFSGASNSGRMYIPYSTG